MSKKENQDYDIIPVNWPVVICVTILFVIAFIVALLIEEKFLCFMVPVMLMILLGGLGQNYILTKEAIICRFFGVTNRTIPWEDIIQAGIARYASRSSTETRIILTLKGCPKYQPEKERGYNYHMRHRDQTIAIDEPEYHFRKIEKYYGTLDYGYDKIYPLK